jgi:hypothetical protein
LDNEGRGMNDEKERYEKLDKDEEETGGVSFLRHEQNML